MTVVRVVLWCICGLRRSPSTVGSLQTSRHDTPKLQTPATVEVEDDEEDSEINVYRPDLRLDDVNTLHDPATASAAYRKVISGLFGWS